ncbi:MAG: hypothetical protein ACM3PU_18180 [Gemmatimonadota bacterium]
MFVVALIGIWRVAPIITYQIQQQEQQAQSRQAASRPVSDDLGGRFIADAFGWWSAQVASYRRILELTAAPGSRATKVSYQLVSSGGTEVVPGLRPDLLIVTSVGPAGDKEAVSVPVNENAMSPSQYLQCRVNQGFFAALAPEQRQQVEIAIARYLHEYMLPKAPPAFVRAGMSLRQLHDEVSLHQDEREKALEHIRALGGVIDKAASADSARPLAGNLAG